MPLAKASGVPTAARACLRGERPFLRGIHAIAENALTSEEASLLWDALRKTAKFV
jgi:hypothetical protein